MTLVSAVVGAAPIYEFDHRALYAALRDAQTERRLSWSAVASEIWALSADLNARRHDHPISPQTITALGKQERCTCQHALFYLRWLDRSPESFLKTTKPVVTDEPLPHAGPDRRLRWQLRQLFTAIEAHKSEHALTWDAVAAELGCTPSQVTGLRTAKFATSMELAMRAVQWLGRPAADFIYAAKW